MQIICYACGRGENPENTIRAIQHCQNVNPDWIIEMDLQLTKDDEVVLFHDYSTERITGVKKKINELSLLEIKELNAGYNFEIKNQFPFREESLKMPTLNEVCSLFAKATFLLDVHTNDLTVVDKIIACINHNEKEDSIIIVSKYDGVLHKFKALKPNWTYGAATKEVKNTVYSSYLFLDGFFPTVADVLMLPVKFGSLTLLTKRVLKHIRKRNKKIWVWLSEGKEVETINSKSQFNVLKDQGVDGVFTEYPNKLNKELKV